MKNYIKTIYSEENTPKTEYPEKLVDYLCQTFKLAPGTILLEPGCGRGEHLALFKKKGFLVEAVDSSQDALELNPDIKISICNLEKEKFPISDNSIDIIYSKSFIEHLNSPIHFLNESYRVLKKGGKIITLVPDWEANYQIYFDDFSHKTPYTKYSLHDAYAICGFKNINTFRFRQLPVVWKYPILNLFCSLIAIFTPHRSKNKFLRWSKELMIAGYAEKN